MHIIGLETAKAFQVEARFQQRSFLDGLKKLPMVEQRLSQAGIVLPSPPRPAGAYRAARIVDGWIFTSGQLSWRDGVIVHPGMFGRDVSLEQGREAAALTTVNLLAQLKMACENNLDRITACARITCFLACTGAFHEHPKVLEPVSSIIIAAFGEEIGAHARLAYGAASLPFNSPVEIEGVFRVSP